VNRADLDPPYDLASDIAGRTQEARARWGNRTRVAVEADAFVLVDPDHGPLFEPGDALVRRVIHSFRSGPLPAAPDHAVTVDIFSTHAAYVAYSKDRYGVDPEPHRPGEKALYGYYEHTTREILVDGTSGWGTLVHELTHPFLERNFDHPLPAWLSEGIASLFEAYAFAPDGSIHGVTNWRYDTLREALASPRHASQMHLPTLFDTTAADFDDSDALTQGRWYALARYACQWLDSDDAGHKLWAFWSDWKSTYDEDPSGLAAFARSVGSTPADADARFLSYVRRLKPGSTGARPDP